MLNRIVDWGRLLSIVVVSAVLTGCATTPHMGYNVQLKPGAPKNISLKINEFTDGRPQQERGVLGGMYNEYNARMGNVNEPAELIKHIQGGFEKELANAGYQINSEKGDLVLNGSVEHISCNLGNKIESQTYVRLQLLDNGTEVLNKLYKGEKVISSLFSMDITCSDPLNGAVENLIVGFTKDLNRYVES